MSGRKRKHKAAAAASQREALSEEDQEQLDNAHRHAFLQVMMQRGWMAEEEAKAHFRQLTGREDDTEYPTFAAIIDAGISPLQIRLKSMRFPLDGAKYIALINEAADEVSKLGSAFKIPQRDFFKALVEQIASEENSTDGNPYIRGIEAFNLNVQHMQRLGSASQAGSSGGSSKRLSTAEIEVLLKQLVVDGWLAHTPEKSGCYSIGVRTFLELGSFLKELPELPEDTQRAWDRVL